ncbi:MAG: MFS transporter [Deltaproteobacteria bacterium]|nr:MAG: MFS transporter [Deltaproteobacteria bacterium]
MYECPEHWGMRRVNRNHWDRTMHTKDEPAINNPSPDPDRWKIFWVVAAGIFMSTLDSSIVNIALPMIKAELLLSLAAAEWIVMAYLLAVTSLLLGFGRLSDMVGHRRIYLTGLSVFSAGSLFCALSGNGAFLVLSRGIQGVGASMIMACTQALVVGAFPTHERGKALGMNGAVVSIGLTAGPILGGYLVEQFNWQAIFWINIPIGMVTAVFAGRLIPEYPREQREKDRFDGVGCLLLASSLCALLMLLSHGHAWGWRSPRIAMWSVLVTVFLWAFIRWEKTMATPLVPPAIFRVRLFVLPVAAGSLMFITLFSIVFLMPFYLTHAAGYTVGEAGRLMTILFGCLFIGAPLSGSLSDIMGSRTLCAAGMLLLSAALFLMGRLTADSSVFSIGWRLALAGMGVAVFISPNTAAVMSALPPHQLGIAGGMVATARNFGMILGIALAGTLFGTTFSRLTGGQPLDPFTDSLIAPFMQAFRVAVAGGGSVGLIGVMVSFARGPETRRK